MHLTAHSASIHSPYQNRSNVGQQNDKIVDCSAVKLDLKGMPGVHGSLDTLLELYGLKPDFSGACVWFVRLPVAEITRHETLQTRFQIEMRTRDGFLTEQIALGVSYQYGDAEAAALTLDSGAFRWTRDASGNRGVMRLVLPEPTKPELIAMHNRKPQHIVHPSLP